MTSVEVIVPCYNYARYLSACVESVLSQENVDVSVLIIDDQSTDDTPEVCRQLTQMDRRVRVIRHTVNQGPIATFNEGLAQASAKYVLLLSADDAITPGSLYRATSLMEDEPEIGFTFGNVIDIQRDGTTERGYPLGNRQDMPARQVLSGPEFIRRSGATNIVPTPTAVVRTTLHHKVGLHHPELKHTGDMEMWLRLASHAAVGFINDDQGIYRRHASNMSLGYNNEHRLADLLQRKRALDILFTHAGPHLAESPDLRQFLIEDLGKEALRQAGMAFNDSQLQSAAAIKHFALDIYPGARTTLPWAKLIVKETLGLRNWRALNALLRAS